MGSTETWIGKAAFVSFLMVVFSLGSMKPALNSPAGPLIPTDLVFPFSLIIVVVSVLTNRRFRWHNGFWMLLFFLITMGVAVIFSQDRPRSAVKFVGSGYLFLLAFAALNCVTSIHRIRTTIIVWIAGAAIPVTTGFAAICLFYLAPEPPTWLSEITYHYGAVPFGYFPRVNATMVSPSMLCNYLTVTLVLVLIALRTGWLEKKLAIALSLAIAVTSIFTASIALGGFALAAGLWISQAATNSLRRVLIPALVVAFAFLMVAPLSMSDAAAGSIAPSSRFLVWSDAAKTFLSDPLFGKGPGLPVASVLFKNSDGTTSLLTDAHNAYLNIAAQAGIIGLAGLLAVIFAVLKTGAGNSGPINELRVVRLGLLIAFISAFIYDGLTGSFEDARHLWILIGLIFAVEIVSSRDSAALQAGDPVATAPGSDSRLLR